MSNQAKKEEIVEETIPEISEIEAANNILFDEKIGGTFHLALGAGYPESGNTNESGLHWDMVCDMRNGGSAIADGLVDDVQDDWAVG